MIWGADDPFFPASHGARLAREISADLVLIEQGDHVPYLVHPDEVARHVLEFLHP